jgi:hypothetical protein
LRLRFSEWGGKASAFLLGWAMFPYSGTLLAMRVLSSPKKNFLLVPDGGFGHTIEEPFTFLTLTEGDGLCVVLCSGKKCNREVSRLFMGRTKFIQISPKAKRLGSASRSVRFVLTRLASALCLLTGKSYWDLERLNQIAKQNGFADMGPRAHLGLFYKLAWEQRSGSKVFEVPMETRNAIMSISDGPKAVMFVRGKGNNSQDKTDSTRDGQMFSSYESFILPLVKSGFKIIPIGETEKLDIESCGPEVRAAVATARDIGVSASELALYGPIVTDFFVGNAGGAGILAALGKKRSVILDGFGYWYAIPNSLISLKLVCDEFGEIVPSTENFSRNVFEISLPEKCNLRGFSVEEQRALAHEFLDLVGSDWNLAEGAYMEPEFSSESWHLVSPNSRLSDTYLRLQRVPLK